MKSNINDVKIVKQPSMRKDVEFNNTPWFVDLQLNNDIQIRNAPKITIDTAAPTQAPKNIGDIFVNTTVPAIYIASGVATAADRRQVF